MRYGENLNRITQSTSTHFKSKYKKTMDKFGVIEVAHGVRIELTRATTRMTLYH